MDLIAGRARPEDAEGLISKTAAELDSLVTSVPRIEARVGEILARRLNDGITVDTWNRLHFSLSAYLGDDVAFLLYWALGVGGTEDEGRMDLLARHASAESIAFLRTIVVIYGGDLELAFEFSNEEPHNWQHVEHKVFLDLASGDIRITVRIRKYSGEEFTIEGPPDFTLNLARVMMALAQRVPPDSFSSAAVQLYIEEAIKLNEYLTSGEAEEEESA